MRDAPWIEAAERYGYPKEPTFPVCPVCGQECEETYHDKWGNFLGCDQCVTIKAADEDEECFPE